MRSLIKRPKSLILWVGSRNSIAFGLARLETQPSIVYVRTPSRYMTLDAGLLGVYSTAMVCSALLGQVVGQAISSRVPTTFDCVCATIFPKLVEWIIEKGEEVR